MLTVSKAYGSFLNVLSIASMPTFTDSIGSPFIEPEVSINKYTGNLRAIL